MQRKQDRKELRIFVSWQEKPKNKNDKQSNNTVNRGEWLMIDLCVYVGGAVCRMVCIGLVSPHQKEMKAIPPFPNHR